MNDEAAVIEAKQDKDISGKVLNVAAKTVIGAAIGVAGGMALITVAAAVEGTVLSYIIFTKVLGVAGGAAGLAHGLSSNHQKSKKT